MTNIPNNWRRVRHLSSGQHKAMHLSTWTRGLLEWAGRVFAEREGIIDGFCGRACAGVSFHLLSWWEDYYFLYDYSIKGSMNCVSRRCSWLHVFLTLLCHISDSSSSFFFSLFGKVGGLRSFSYSLGFHKAPPCQAHSWALSMQVNHPSHVLGELREQDRWWWF